MNVITKSGNLAPYLRATTQVVGSSVKITAPAIPATEKPVAKKFDVTKANLNNALAAQTALVGGKLMDFSF